MRLMLLAIALIVMLKVVDPIEISGSAGKALFQDLDKDSPNADIWSWGTHSSDTPIKREQSAMESPLQAQYMSNEKIRNINLPNATTNWNNQGISFFREGNYTKALQAFDTAIKINPKYIHSWTNKGLTLNKLNRYNEALLAFDMVLKAP